MESSRGDAPSETLTVLVTGATGFVGSRLVPALLAEGHRVRAMTRRPEEYDGPGTPVRGDVDRAGSMGEALEGVDVAYYLVHSLDRDDFEDADAKAAHTFGQVAAQQGVRQIVYLGGLGADGDLSPHLRSRRMVEQLLGEPGCPVTVLRAAVVVGHGGASWEITRELVARLPAMVVPPWARTRTQPISLDDTIRYLVGVAGREEAFGRVFEIGGPEVMTYQRMLQVAGEVMSGESAPVVSVPGPGSLPMPVPDRLSPTRLSSQLLSLISGVDATTARNLIESMGTEVVVTDDAIRDLVPGEPLSYEEAVRRALEERGR